MCRREIDALLASVPAFAQRALLLLYFSGGFRNGEPERVRPDLLNGDELDIAEVQRKTKERRKTAAQCRAPLAVQALIQYFAGEDPELDDVKVKQCRPTAATWLALSGVSTMEIAVRLGHTSRKMTDEHYVRPEFVRHVKDGAKGAASALWIYDGEQVDFAYPGAPVENHWGCGLLFRLLLEARECGELPAIKQCVQSALGVEMAPVKKRAVSF